MISSAPIMISPALRRISVPLLMLMLMTAVAIVSVDYVVAEQGLSAHTNSITITATLLSDGRIGYNDATYVLYDDSSVDNGLSAMTSNCDIQLEPITSSGFWINLGLSALLVLGGGIVSGLTIGLFSLSNLELEVLQEDIEASEIDRRRAKKLEPLLREDRHHLLLVTLLLTNTAMMEALPELLDKLVPEWAAVLISVSLVLIFSEILPQSICTKSPLAVGAFFSPLVWLLMLLLFPLAWPISKALYDNI